MPTILVIDDNPAVATALETLFSLHDIDTRSATTPAGRPKSRNGSAWSAPHSPTMRGSPVIRSTMKRKTR